MSYAQYAVLAKAYSEQRLAEDIDKMRHNRDTASSDRAYNAWNQMLQILLTESARRLANNTTAKVS